MVCNSSQGESLSAIEAPKKEQEQTNLKTITSKEFKQKKDKKTKKDKNVCNARERKGLSLDFIDKYILRIYMLSSALAEKKETKKNKQKAVGGKPELLPEKSVLEKEKVSPLEEAPDKKSASQGTFGFTTHYGTTPQTAELDGVKPEVVKVSPEKSELVKPKVTKAIPEKSELVKPKVEKTISNKSDVVKSGLVRLTMVELEGAGKISKKLESSESKPQSEVVVEAAKLDTVEYDVADKEAVELETVKEISKKPDVVGNQAVELQGINLGAVDSEAVKSGEVEKKGLESDTVKFGTTDSEALKSRTVELQETSRYASESATLPPLDVISDGSSGDSQTMAGQSVTPNLPAHGNNDLVAEDKLTQERSKFLKGLGIDIPEKLAELVNRATIEQVNNLRQLLKENKTLTNPVGFLIKALKNNWQPKQKPSTPTKPSWHDEFEEFYNQAIKAGYCEDLPINYLSRNHRNEPMVRVNKPHPWLGAPYTLVYWREAREEFRGDR
nr:hypothetical protein A5482_07940 [Cyanobacterium sp. IPPAS B-1200]